MSKVFTQCEILELIRKYNNTDRQTIKQNLRRIMQERRLKAKDITELGYNKNNVGAWLGKTVSNIPMIHQALDISTNFNFDVREFLKENKTC